MITLLDYGAGNVRSVINAIENLGHKVRLVRTGQDLLEAEKLVFPGVGAFGSMMEILHQRNLVEPLKRYLAADRPFLGICLGMQALFAGSEEAPGVPGLGLLPGRVKRFTVDLAVPHIGWNGVRARQASRIFAGLEGDEKFYFVHSYHLEADESVVLTVTDYGYPFVSAVQRGNIIGTQFHRKKAVPPGPGSWPTFWKTTGPLRCRPAFPNGPAWPNASSPAWMYAPTTRATWW